MYAAAHTTVSNLVWSPCTKLCWMQNIHSYYWIFKTLMNSYIILPRKGLFWDTMQILDPLWVRGQPPASLSLCRVSEIVHQAASSHDGWLSPPQGYVCISQPSSPQAKAAFGLKKSEMLWGLGYYLNAQTPEPCIMIYFLFSKVMLFSFEVH